MKPDKAAAARAIDAFLIALGRDAKVERDLEGTGARVADAYLDELCAGYDVDVDALVREATIPGENGGIVELRDVALTTTCPHHLMTGVGKATVGFAPRGKIMGVGAIARLLDAFARRLTLQETIGEGVVAAMERNLAPRWVACRIEMSHACMIARGERTHGAKLVTFAMRGVDEAARAEAISFVQAPLK
ncbi:MAG TPA: GTP cyclohydrolase I [Polyangiaceae bacterium]